MKTNLKRMIPVFLVLGITLIMSFLLYNKVTEREEDRCWELLSDSSQSVIKEIRMKFEDNITILGLAANTMAQDDKFEPDQISSLHLDDFEENSIFSRIDILYPDDTILYENGTHKKLRDDVTFREIAELGEHISSRMIDTETGKEAVYYYMPVKKNGQYRAILTGVIACDTLAEIFQPTIYDGQAVCCIVDSVNGDYIMDNWHDGLGNAYDTPDRKRLKGYEDIDLKSEIKNQQTGTIAFESRTNGLDTYLYYAPIGLFDWELLVVTQETVIFSSLIYLKNLLIIVGIIEAILLLLYFFWNYSTVRQLTKSRQETEQQLEISTTLIQCVTELASDKDIEISIQNLLEIINQYFHSDRTYIFELSADKKDLYNTYEYVKPGITPQIDNLQAVPVSVLPHWMESFQKFQPYYISSLEQEKEYESYEILKVQDIERLIAVPLGKPGDVIGFVGVDNPGQFYDDATLLSSIQFFLTNSLSTKKQKEYLKYMSYRDMLTTLFNRNKYMQVLDSSKEVPLSNIGVAYIDLNGLKRLNDQEGHEAGDRFICSAAQVILEIFPEHGYRIGGDEFVILMPDTSQEEFSEKIQQLQKNMEARKVSISIGSLWKETCNDLELLLKDADQVMYQAKQRYYQSHDRRKN